MTEHQVVRLIAAELNKKIKECSNTNNRKSAEFISAYGSMLVLNEILFKIYMINISEGITPPFKIEYEQSD